MIQERSLDFLKRLMRAISPSGFESEASHLWCEEIKKFADSVRVDSHGNSIAVIN